MRDPHQHRARDAADGPSAPTVDRVSDSSQQGAGPEPGVVDLEVRAALALRAVTRVVAILAATAFAVGIVAVGVAAMARVEEGGDGAQIVMPGISVLMVGQLAALVATGLAVWVLVRLVRRRVPDPARALDGLSRALGLCSRVLLAGCVVAIAVWAFLRPSSVLSAVVGALVAAQVAVVFGVVRGVLKRART